MWRKGNAFVLSVGMQTGAATVESNMEFPQKTKNGTAFWSSNPTSGNNISKGNINTTSKEHKHPYVHCSVIYNRQDMKAAQVDKTTLGHLHNGYYLTEKRRKFYPLQLYGWSWEHYTKWNKPVRERQLPYDFTHMWNLMNKWTHRGNGDKLIDGEQDDSWVEGG